MDIRKKFQQYYIKLGFSCKKSFSLINNDQELLFVNSGMVPFKDLFSLNCISEPSKIVNSQLCLRLSGKHNDLEEIGVSSTHATSFEMLGNFIFQPFDTTELLNSAYLFLTEECLFNKNHIHVTCHSNSKEIYNSWVKIIGSNKIFIDDTNIWMSGKEGPKGFCTEIYYKNVEVWNLVFVDTIIRDQVEIKKNFTMLDAGMGLERLMCFCEKKDSVYDIKIYENFFNSIKNLINKNDTYNSRIIIDHIKTIVSICIHKIIPSNKMQGYVLRKLIRRCIRSCNAFNIIQFEHLTPLIYSVLEYLNEIFSNIQENKDELCQLILRHLYSEKQLLSNAENKIAYLLKNKNSVSKKDLDYMYNTHGIHIDMIKEFCKDKNIKIEL